MTDAVVFDMYGTLFDVHSIRTRADEVFPDRGAEISAVWRVRQIDYTRLRTMAGRYVPFSAVTREALIATCAQLGLDVREAEIDYLVDAYRTLTPYPEVREVLDSLAAAGITRVILTNGDHAMVDPLLAYSRLATSFEHVLSADVARAYKTDPRVYQLAVDHVAVSAERILFVSANQWDAVGGSWFGFATVWVNRSGEAPEELGIRPTFEVTDLRDIVTLTSKTPSTP